MFVYLEGSYKGVPEKHVVICNPGNHLGVLEVPSAWTEKNPQGEVVGRTFHVEFRRGRAAPEDRLGLYLIEYGHAQRTPWRQPAGADETDPAWRWREEAPV